MPTAAANPAAWRSSPPTAAPRRGLGASPRGRNDLRQPKQAVICQIDARGQQGVGLSAALDAQ